MSRRQKQPRLAEVTELAAEGYGLTEDQRFGVYGLLPGERATIYPRRKKKGRWLATHDARVKMPILIELRQPALTLIFVAAVHFSISIMPVRSHSKKRDWLGSLPPSNQGCFIGAAWLS